MANVVGIEITEQSVRAALLRISGRKQEPLRYLEVPLAQLGEGGSRATALSGAVRELFEALGERPDSVHLALDGRHVSLRSVSIPAAAAKRAAEVLPFELESQLPFPVSEAIIDYQPVASQDGELTLLAAAAPHAAIASALASLAALGLDPRELPPGAVALDALPIGEAAPDDAVLLAHVESDRTELCVVRSGHCELARTLDDGLEAAHKTPAAFRTALVQTVSMYRTAGGPAPVRLLVSGTGGNQPSFVEWLGGLLQLPASAVHLPPVEGGGAVAPTFGAAYSLAARTARREKRLNLRRGPFAAASGEGFARRHAGLLTACAAALALAYVFSVWSQYQVLARERDKLAESLHDLSQRRLGEGTRSAQRARDLLERVGQSDDPLPEFDAVQALGVISDAVDSSITHSTRKLEIQLDDGGGDGTFELNGSVPDLASRDKIASTLEGHECIRDLEKGRTSSLPGKDTKTYTLEGSLGCGPVKKSHKKTGKRRGGAG